MADFGLPYAVNPTEALLDAVWIPRQVIVDHEVGALEIDALAGGVGCKQHLNLGVVSERFLRLQAFLSADATVNDNDGFAPTSSVLIRCSR